MSADSSHLRSRPPAVPLFVVVLLAGYSAVLIGIELATSQEYVRHFVTDIDGPVPFHAINTSLSVFLQWSTALLFLLAAAVPVRSHRNRPTVYWLVSQVVFFAWLGCDDRFKFHELLGGRLGIGDHYVLLALAGVEGLLLTFACLRGWIYGAVVQSLLLASVLFAFMLGVDALAPHALPLRLSVEDAAKTCACFFFLRFAWQMLFLRMEQRLADVAEELQSASLTGDGTWLQGRPLAGRRVLLLGEDLRMVLPVARSLGSKGCEIHLGWTSPQSPVRASRHVDTVHELPLPSADSAGWIEPLQRLLQEQHFDLVFPVTESAVHAVQPHRSLLEPLACLSLLDDTVFHRAFDKSAMERLARTAGVTVQDSVVVDSIEQAEQYFASNPGQVVIKPGCSVEGCGFGSKQFVQIVEDPQVALQIVGQLLRSGQGSVLLQEY
ncbi:MAG: hypothetical protein KDA79_07945, partial [Planctomycetaceae bacterium]|nr:hypothetical protein [Planctomycetaceae bacterium]